MPDQEMIADIQNKLKGYLKWFPQGTGDDFDTVKNAYGCILKIFGEHDFANGKEVWADLDKKVDAVGEYRREDIKGIVVDFMDFFQNYLNTLTDVSERQEFYELATALVCGEKIESESDLNKANEVIRSLSLIENELVNRIRKIVMANEAEREQVVQAIRFIIDPNIVVTEFGKKCIEAVLDYIGPDMAIVQESQMPAVHAIIKKEADNIEKMTSEDLAQHSVSVADAQEMIKLEQAEMKCAQVYREAMKKFRDAHEKFNDANRKHRDASVKSLDAYTELTAQYSAAKAQVNKAQINEAYPQLAEAKAQFDEPNARYKEAHAQFKEAHAQCEEVSAQYDEAGRRYKEAKKAHEKALAKRALKPSAEESESVFTENKRYLPGSAQSQAASGSSGGKEAAEPLSL